tara:strand:- start:151 stop:621 length:471 start_codon:yes stop_codon:yes gene_type:complete
MKLLSIKILLISIISSFLLGCGFEPLLSQKNQIYRIEKTYIEGDRRLGQILANNLNLTSASDRKASIYINADLSKEISDRSTAGKIKEYSINITYNIKIIDSESLKVLIEKRFDKSGSYQTSVLHLDTLNNEKKIVNNLIKSIAEQIMNDLSLIKN